jgi:hypothetical protein
MVTRREDGQLGMFSFCLPVDISSDTGCCQNCWSHAKAQSQDRSFNFPAIHLSAFAPLREEKAGIDNPFENGLIGIISSCLPVSSTPFHHPRAKLPLSCIPAANTASGTHLGRTGRLTSTARHRVSSRRDLAEGSNQDQRSCKQSHLPHFKLFCHPG